MVTGKFLAVFVAFLALASTVVAEEECTHELTPTDFPPVIDGTNGGGGSEYVGCNYFDMYKSFDESQLHLATAQICVDCSYWYVKVEIDYGNAARVDKNGAFFTSVDGVELTPLEFAWLEDYGNPDGWEAKYQKPADRDIYRVDVVSDIIDFINGETHTARFGFAGGSTIACVNLDCPTSAPTPGPVGTPTLAPVAAPTKSPLKDTEDRSTGDGGSFGDPHLKTWRGQHIEFHAQCDLLLVHSEKFANGKGMTIHIRTEVRKNWSFISAAVLRIGKETLEMNKHGKYFLNGSANPPMPNAIGGYNITLSFTEKGRVSLDIDLGHNGHIALREFKEFVSAHVARGRPEDFSDSIGLMGDFFGGRMLLRDGVTIVSDPKVYAQEWQVRDTDERLFRVSRAPQFPHKCKWPETLNEIRARRLDTGISREEALKACKDWGDDIEQCVYDVMATGDLEMASGGSW